MPLTTIYDGGTRIVGDATALEESLHPAVMAYVNTMRSPTGGNYAMTVNEIDAVNNMVKAMVANGIWSKMKAVYPVIGGTAAAHKYNLVDPRDADAAFRLSFLGGGWVHSSTGITPNGTSSYVDTFLNASSILTANNNSLSYYSRTSAASTIAAAIDMGAVPNQSIDPSLYALVIRRPNNISSFASNTNTTAIVASTTVLNGSGFFIGSITNSSNRQLYRNGITIASNTTTGSQSLPSLKIFIGAISNNNVASLFSNKECAFASIGDGLTNAEARAFYQIVQTYQTKLGRQV